MNLKEIQQPIKEQYRKQPDSAKVTLKAKGSQVNDGPMACNVDLGRAIVAAQAHSGVGGPGTAACSGDLLLAALAGCTQLTAQLVAESMGLALRNIEALVEGDLDLRGTLGIDREAPVGFTDIRLKLHVEGDIDAETLASFERKVERYCVVLQTLKQPPRIESVVHCDSGVASKAVAPGAATETA